MFYYIILFLGSDIVLYCFRQTFVDSKLLWRCWTSDNLLTKLEWCFGPELVWDMSPMSPMRLVMSKLFWNSKSNKVLFPTYHFREKQLSTHLFSVFVFPMLSKKSPPSHKLIFKWFHLSLIKNYWFVHSYKLHCQTDITHTTDYSITLKL